MIGAPNHLEVDIATAAVLGYVVFDMAVGFIAGMAVLYAISHWAKDATEARTVS